MKRSGREKTPATGSDDVQETLRRRRDSLARAEDEAQSVETASLLAFAVGDERYAVPLDAVREIQSGYTVARIPCAPPHILGVISVRGEIVSVTDLGVLLGVPEHRTRPSQAASRPAIIIAEGLVASALVVDEIGDIVDVPADAVEPPLSAQDRHEAPLVRGSVEIDGQMIAIVDCATVLEPIDSVT